MGRGLRSLPLRDAEVLAANLAAVAGQPLKL